MKNAGTAFATNFKLAMAMLDQEGFIQPNLPQMAAHFWATFFLAVPVVSSTFASFSRCFSDLGEGQIGLLLIDEAGQAVPAHALGAIWRAKRALLVGDPLQVDPVISISPKLDEQIRHFHAAPERHQLTRYSAQHLADRVNQHGAHVMQYDGEALWVGSPLRVHRRCVDPMFSLSNAIAYDNTMVLGPKPEDEITETSQRPLWGRSRWIDQAADDFDSHFSTAEGMMALRLVTHYRRHGWVNAVDGLPEVFLISPFKSVADGLRSLLEAERHTWAVGVNEPAVAAWLKGHVGTVHTFQGKECETVIFVLGGKTAGAINWAASKPNIINVAATRAKRRLYVIGNREKWQKTRFGKAMADAFETDANDAY
jgi:superfamily I DNA and/or RNA helicase